MFSTQKGSSLFFETVLIMLALSSLPYWRRIRGYVVALTSMLPIGVAIVRYHILVPWQDRYDIVIFYILCLFIMTLRRHWLEQNFWLMHRTELENRALEKESRTDELTGLENRTGLREDFPSFAGEQVIMIMMTWIILNSTMTGMDIGLAIRYCTRPDSTSGKYFSRWEANVIAMGR